MSELEPRNGSHITAQDIIGALIDTMTADGIPVSSRAKGIIARKSKELLTDGFSPEVVLAAAVIVVRRVEPQNMDYVAQEIAVIKAGRHLTRIEYRREMDRAAQKLKPLSNVERIMRGEIVES